MNILIFGSGSAVSVYINYNKEFFENYIEILAFLDNNPKKVWTETYRKGNCFS